MTGNPDTSLTIDTSLMLSLFRLVVHQMYLYQYTLHQYIRDAGPNTAPVARR